MRIFKRLVCKIRGYHKGIWHTDNCGYCGKKLIGYTQYESIMKQCT